MDAVGSAVGLFQACLHAYRAVAQATEIGAESVIWDVLMRIELTRFEVWGRMLGFLDEKTGKEKSQDEIDKIIDLAEILQIEAARDLVKDILKSLKRSLEEFGDAAKKYRLKPDSLQAQPPADGKKRRFEMYVKKVWKSSKDLSMHLLLIVQDKDMIENLLKDLTAFNDGLEKVLSVSQRALSARALPSKVLADYNDATQLDVFNEPDPALDKTNSLHAPPQHRFLAATARVKQICLRPRQQEESTFVSYELEEASFDIPSKSPSEDKDLLSSISIGQYTSDGESSTPVLIEWRSPEAQSRKSKISTEELVRRRSMVVRLLHETSKLAAADYRVLDCFGWFSSKGQASEGRKRDLIGFASKIPNWVDTARKPVSLHSLLTASFENQDPGTIPSLRTRFRLARDVAQVVYQLQCSRWLHRTLSSHRVLFFYDEQTGELKFDLPYLIGLQYSRPDDQDQDDTRKKRENALQNFSEGNPKDLGPLGLYLHPDLLYERSRRYRRSDDIHSLGVILFEIAFWEPAQAFIKPGHEGWNIGHARFGILKTVETELEAEVGPIYQQVVSSCIRGLRKSSSPLEFGFGEEDADEGLEEYDGSYRGEDPEYGLESEVLWRVVRELEKCRV